MRRYRRSSIKIEHEEEEEEATFTSLARACRFSAAECNLDLGTVNGCALLRVIEPNVVNVVSAMKSRDKVAAPLPTGQRVPSLQICLFNPQGN